MIYIIDIDGTICPNNVEKNEYDKEPYWDRIQKVNDLYDGGHEIIYYTARGATTGINWYAFTLHQLLEWGCRFHDLRVGKPHYHFWIDDKALNSEDFFK